MGLLERGLLGDVFPKYRKLYVFNGITMAETKCMSLMGQTFQNFCPQIPTPPWSHCTGACVFLLECLSDEFTEDSILEKGCYQRIIME
jgi:hypothetical protein